MRPPPTRRACYPRFPYQNRCAAKKVGVVVEEKEEEKATDAAKKEAYKALQRQD
jgi:hypothetical protein